MTRREEAIAAAGDRIRAGTGTTMVAGDLFALADAAAAIMDGAVTIHDAHLQVVAYAGEAASADEVWVETVLSRQLPAWLQETWSADGTLSSLARMHGPLLVPSPGPGIHPRVACPIRSEPRLLGSLWAVAATEPSAGHLELLLRCGELAVAHLSRLLAEADQTRQVENEQIAALIHGGAGSEDAAAALGLERGPFRALAMGVRTADSATRLRLFRRLRARLGTTRASGPLGPVTVGELGGTIFVVLGGSGRSQPPESGSTWLGSVALGDRELQDATIVGVGGEVETIASLPLSRAEAERALAVVRSGGGAARVATYAAVWPQALVQYLRNASLPPELLIAEPLRRILEHDTTHHTQYESTLRAYYDTFGDAAHAGRVLHVHTNTIRYRLKRIHELIEADLDRADLRLALSLQLTLRAERQGRNSTR